MSNLPPPRYSLWQAISAALELSLRAIAEVRALARVPGPQGERGERGADGLGFNDIKPFTDERTYGFDLERGGEVKQLRWPKLTMADCYRGVWRDGEEYRRGDGVTYGGSFWLAQRDTSGMPEVSADWTLVVKRGRDGKDLRDGVVRKSEPVKFK